MATAWENLSPEAQAELQGYVSFVGETGSELRQAALDQAANAYADMGNAYQGFLTGRNMPPTPTAVTMETTTTSSEPLTGEPESMRAALLKHGAAEGAEREAEHWRQYAARETSAADSDPGAGMDAYRASFNAAPGSEAGQGSYGVGAPSQNAQQTTPEQSHGPEL